MNVILPWKLHKHFILSKRRLNNLQNSLDKKDPGLIKKYNEQLLEQVNLGFIAKVRDLNLHEGILHHLPHFTNFETARLRERSKQELDESKWWNRELTLKCKLKCYVKPMKDPLGVSPSKGNQGTTRGKEKIF